MEGGTAPERPVRCRGELLSKIHMPHKRRIEVLLIENQKIADKADILNWSKLATHIKLCVKQMQ